MVAGNMCEVCKKVSGQLPTCLEHIKIVFSNRSFHPYLQLLRTYIDQGKQKEVLLTEEDLDNAEDSRYGLPCAHVHLLVHVLL